MESSSFASCVSTAANGLNYDAPVYFLGDVALVARSHPVCLSVMPHLST